jgi:uncharacterized protein YdiU (UPF0061 family)
MISLDSAQKQLSTDKQHLKPLTQIEWANTQIKNLPIEENPTNRPHKVIGYNYSYVTPEKRLNPRIVALSEPCLEMLEIDPKTVEKDPESAEYLCGNKLLAGSKPIAHNYCGYQFGSWAEQLGDGRAITIGDLYNSKGELYELQFKGSGQTPYSRFADGKAVLRSSVREFLCSEAMWALGIPTTRAASLIVTDTLADRDLLYNGNVIKEKCAVVLRVAPTFWRFGSFEIFKGPSAGKEHEMLPKMLDYLLTHHFKDIMNMEDVNKWSRSDLYYEMYCEIARRTAQMVAMWQCYGFMHGVLNTDNMSALGLTIDFGPFGWMDYMNKQHICNHSDKGGRYSYENQPSICKWNLGKLAEAWKPAGNGSKMFQYLKENYDTLYNTFYYGKMREKLGLICYELPEDEKLIDELFNTMHENSSDFNNTFRRLAIFDIPNKFSGNSEDNYKKTLEELSALSADLDTLLALQKPQYTPSQLAQLKMIANGNIHYLMMMGIEPETIELEEEKMNEYKKLEKMTQKELTESISKRWVTWLDKYSTRLHKETEAVVSPHAEKKIEVEEDSKEGTIGAKKPKLTVNSYAELCKLRQDKMNSVNPVYILRNYMAEEAIKQAEGGDNTGVKTLLDILLNPFSSDESKGAAWKHYKESPPKWAGEICVSCSS